MTLWAFTFPDGYEPSPEELAQAFRDGEYRTISSEELELGAKVDSLDEKLTSVRNMVFAINSRTKGKKAVAK